MHFVGLIFFFFLSFHYRIIYVLIANEYLIYVNEKKKKRKNMIQF